ncbi:MAG TPA: tRNA pseudouridine(55) synthase TruB [Gemmatimonadota bacterium]|nr:tRNA pseudouridine(55) synthase TruB [Gemmatimonadota bacterium]
MTAGVLAVDKPVGPTSHDVVGAVRRSLGIRQIGHFGTLDPFASGLLVLGVGPATRLAAFCVGHSKTYRATVRLGERSDTDDSEGAIEPVAVPEAPGQAAVEKACAAWVGSVQQFPPVYSAKHVNGRRAYALARAGETVTLEAVPVRVDSIEVERYQWPDLDIVVRCGPGTYVRALARDLGEELGTGAHCAALRRLESGPFRVEHALAWSDLSDPATARAAVMPSWRAVADLPATMVDAEGRLAFAQGRETHLPPGGAVSAGWARVHGPGGFLGIGQVVVGEDGVLRMQPRRVLFPNGEDSG